MAEFTISITGDATGDEVRAVFEQAVRGLRAVLAEFDGELVTDGVTENADDVSDDVATDEISEEEDDQTDDGDTPGEEDATTTEETT